MDTNLPHRLGAPPEPGFLELFAGFTKSSAQHHRRFLGALRTLDRGDSDFAEDGAHLIRGRSGRSSARHCNLSIRYRAEAQPRASAAVSSARQTIDQRGHTEDEQLVPLFRRATVPAVSSAVRRSVISFPSLIPQVSDSSQHLGERPGVDAELRHRAVDASPPSTQRPLIERGRSGLSPTRRGAALGVLALSGRVVRPAKARFSARENRGGLRNRMIEEPPLASSPNHV